MSQPPTPSTVRCGIHAFDLILGDGIPLGKIVEFSGPEAVGKSVLAWHAAKGFQAVGGTVILYDQEATAPVEFMTKCGVDQGAVIWRRKKIVNKVKKGGKKIVQRSLDTIEAVERDILQLLPDLRKVTDAPLLFIWDSVAASSAEGEWEDTGSGWTLSDKHRMAMRAAAWSDCMRHLVKRLSANNATLLLINQMRERPGVMYGKKTDTTGGRAIKHYSAVRVELRRAGKINKEGDIVGVECLAETIKSKVAAPFRKAELKIFWDRGFDRMAGLMKVLGEAGRLKLSKGNWTYKGLVLNRKLLSKLIEKQPSLLAPWP